MPFLKPVMPQTQTVPGFRLGLDLTNPLNSPPLTGVCAAYLDGEIIRADYTCINIHRNAYHMNSHVVSKRVSFYFDRPQTL